MIEIEIRELLAGEKETKLIPHKINNLS